MRYAQALRRLLTTIGLTGSACSGHAWAQDVVSGPLGTSFQSTALCSPTRAAPIPGQHKIELDFQYDAMGAGTLARNEHAGVGRPGTGTLKIHRKAVDARTLPMTFPWDGSSDVGSNTLTGVNDADYQPPFQLTAKLDKLPPEGEKALIATINANRASEQS